LVQKPQVQKPQEPVGSSQFSESFCVCFIIWCPRHVVVIYELGRERCIYSISLRSGSLTLYPRLCMQID
jgi:hypothetical protein